MKIGSNCFSDKTFKSIVDSLHNVGTCEITKSENQKIKMYMIATQMKNYCLI